MIGDPLRVCIGDEYLPFGPKANLFEQVVHAFFVQFFKNVVEQQERGELFLFFENIEFREAQGKQKTFTLSLGSDSAKWLIVESKNEIVLMNACGGALQQSVALPELPEKFVHRAGPELALVFNVGMFLCAGDSVVNRCYHRAAVVHVLFPLFKNKDAVGGKLHIVHVEQAHIGIALLGCRFKETVALLQHFIVTDKSPEIFRLGLGDNGVDIPSSFLASIGDHADIVGGNDHTGQFAHMGGEPFAGFPVHEKLLAARFAQNADRFDILSIPGKPAFYPEPCLPGMRIEGVGPAEIALCEAQIVDRIEQVRLSHSVPAADADDPGIEPEILLEIVLEPGE